MRIVLNGKPEEAPETETVASLLDRLNLGGKRLALEVNEAIVPRSAYSQHRLKQDDRIEIVHAIGGG
jgi:sulfur carrier protein